MGAFIAHKVADQVPRLKGQTVSIPHFYVSYARLAEPRDLRKFMWPTFASQRLTA